MIFIHYDLITCSFIFFLFKYFLKFYITLAIQQFMKVDQLNY